MSYRNLTDKEITTLINQGCYSVDWTKVLVKNGFLTDHVVNTQFADNVKLGIFNNTIEVEKGINKHTGIRNSFISNCNIGDNVLISDVSNLANYHIADRVVLENVGTIVVNGKSTFGNGTNIEVLNEGGGREIPIFDRLSSQLAYLLTAYRHDSELIENLQKMVGKYVENKKSIQGEIGFGAKIIHTAALKNVNVGAYAAICGASLLSNGTIGSCKEDPAFIGTDVVAEHFIILSGSHVDSGTILSHTFVGQSVRLGKQFSAENSVFFANCEGFHGEACSVFAGPYTVTHHKSTLLIAGMFSFFNAGSGTNQSNHMYKLGPLHQGIVERGSKTGSFSYMLWPCRVGPFSVVMDKHSANFDTADLPFSYINVENGKSVITPAMNLFTVGTRRDSTKWPTRDRRKDPEKLDFIHFDFLNPYIMNKVLKGSDLLKSFYDETPRTKEFVNYKGVNILRLMLRTTRKYYEMLISIYIGSELIKRLGSLSKFSTVEEIIQKLKISEKGGINRWMDIAGMYVSKDSLEKLLSDIRNGNISTLLEFQNEMNYLFKEYDSLSWNWSASLIEKRCGKKIDELSGEQIIRIIKEWETNTVKLNNMILKDAEKEFDQTTKIGFGVDGDETTRDADFDSVRGVFEKNKFVIELKQESERIRKKTQCFISGINKMV